MSDKSILIVEDDNDLRDAYMMILQSEGFEVVAAENGQVALDTIKKNGDPRVIFLDLRMPVMNGIEFLKEYKPSSHQQTEIIVFSNYDAKNEIDEAFELGAHRYVLKARAAPKELIRIARTVIA